MQDESHFHEGLIRPGVLVDEQPFMPGANLTPDLTHRLGDAVAALQFGQHHLAGPRMVTKAAGVVLSDEANALCRFHLFETASQGLTAICERERVGPVTRPGGSQALQIAKILIQEAFADSGRIQHGVHPDAGDAVSLQQALEGLHQGPLRPLTPGAPFRRL